MVVHLIELIVWASFLVWRDAMPSAADALCFTLLQYVTVGSGPRQQRRSGDR